MADRSLPFPPGGVCPAWPPVQALLLILHSVLPVRSPLRDGRSCGERAARTPRANLEEEQPWAGKQQNTGDSPGGLRRTHEKTGALSVEKRHDLFSASCSISSTECIWGGGGGSLSWVLVSFSRTPLILQFLSSIHTLNEYSLSTYGQAKLT